MVPVGRREDGNQDEDAKAEDPFHQVVSQFPAIYECEEMEAGLDIARVGVLAVEADG